MKAEITIRIPDGTPYLVESPRVYGLCDLNRLARLLDGEDTRNLFGSDFRPPPGFGLGSSGEVIAIPINDAPLNEVRHVSRVVVTSWPLKAQIVPGVLLERYEGRWVVGAGLKDDISSKDAPALLIREPWIGLLARLIALELEPYLQLAADLSRVVDARIVHEVQSRCNIFNQRGLEGFFHESAESHLWLIGANWEDWEDRGLSVGERLQDLKARDASVSMHIKKFSAVLQSNGLVVGTKVPGQNDGVQPLVPRRPPTVTRPEFFTVLRGKPAHTARLLSEFADDEQLKTIFMGGAYPDLGQDTPLSERELALTRDWGPETDGVFSYGGDPEMNYDLDPAIRATFEDAHQEAPLRYLLDHVWWWKAVGKDFIERTCSIAEIERAEVRRTEIRPWNAGLTGLFFDNWEWSAWLYEMRARYRGRYAWEPFEKPWPKLNHTERAILAIWWPPKHVGRHRIQRMLSPVVLQEMKSLVAVRLQHDLRAPGSSAEEQVLDEIKELAGKAGVKVPGKGQGRRKKLPWRALQYLDLEHFLGRKLPDSDSKLKDAIKGYEAACKAAGIDP